MIHPNVHTAGGGKQFTMLTREKDTLLCPPLLVVETDTALRSHRRYTLMSTLLTVEINTPSRSQPAGGGKGYTPTPTHTLIVDSGKENILTFILLVVVVEKYKYMYKYV